MRPIEPTPYVLKDKIGSGTSSKICAGSVLKLKKFELGCDKSIHVEEIPFWIHAGTLL